MSPAQNWSVATSSMFFNRANRNSDALELQGLVSLKEAGLDGIELVIPANSLAKTPTETWQNLDLSLERIKKAGLTLFSVHLPFGGEWDISAIDEAKRQWAVSTLAKCLQWAGAAGIKTAVIHSSAEPIEAAQRALRLAQSRKSLAELAGVGYQYDVTLAVECLPRTCLGNNSQELSHLVAGIDNIAVCMDINHLLQETPAEFIAALGSRIRTVHMSDYDGVDERHWLPGKGIINWEEAISLLAAAGYEGPFMFEVPAKNELTPKDLVDCWRHFSRNAGQSAVAS